MSCARSVATWFRATSYVALAGCAGMDAPTVDGPGPDPRFTLDPGPATVAQVLPEPPVDPSTVPPPCGDCALSCGVAQRCLDAVCTPTSDSTPRLLAPQSFGRVTSHRPTFRWVLPAHVVGARVQLCSDRSCRTALETVDLVGGSLRPARALEPGVYFWRVFARRGDFISEKSSPVWEFVVGARDADVDTVQDSITDLNGDGYADLALRLDPARPVGLYLGSPRGLGPAPAARVTLPGGEGVRATFTLAGDLDGDGFVEALSVATRGGDPRQRTVYLYHGGPNGLGTAPEVLPALEGSERWPDTFHGAGDLNADGYGDLVGVDFERDHQPARVRVFFGAAQGLQAAPGVLLQGEAGDGLGASVSGNGDVNGDGRPDLLVGSPSPAGPGIALLWVNRPGVCLHRETTRLWGDDAPASLFGRAVSAVGDFDGDGHADPLVAEPYDRAVTSRGRMMMFHGADAGVGTAPTRTMMFGGAHTEAIRLRAGGDFNGDGYGDVVAWMHNEARGPTMHLFYGSPQGLSAAARVIRSSDLGSTETALSFAWTGDADRDGYDDLVLALRPTEWLFLRGSAGGLQVIDGPHFELP